MRDCIEIQRTDFLIELGIVQVLNDLLDGLDRAVPARDHQPSSFLASSSVVFSTIPQSLAIGHLHLEVSSDEELTCHLCDCCDF
jgi:hypothetical protein